jgi:hypothetical protein
MKHSGYLLLIISALLISPAQTRSQTESKKEPQPASSHPWNLLVTGGQLVKQDNSRVPATLQNIVDYLRENYVANVVLAPSVGTITVEDLKLSGFRWESALEALRIASGNQFIWRSSRGATPAVDPMTGAAIPAEPAEDDLFVLERDPSAAQVASLTTLEVFNLAGYLQGKEPEQVSEALNQVQDILTGSFEQIRASGVWLNRSPAQASVSMTRRICWCWWDRRSRSM